LFGKLTQYQTDFYIDASVSNRDMFFRGIDGGTQFVALTLDMSAAGAATFNSSVSAVNYTIPSTANIFASSNNLYIQTQTNGTGIVLNSRTGFLTFQNNGATSVQFGTSASVFNEAGADIDFRVESDTNAHALFVQGSNSFVGINTAVPGVELDITRITNSYPLRIGSTSASGRAMVFADISGSPAKRNWVMGAQYNTDDGWELTPSTAAGGYTFTNRVLTAYGSTGNLVVNENGIDADFRVESNGNANMFKVDGALNAVGIGVAPSNSYRALTVDSGDENTGIHVHGENSGIYIGTSYTGGFTTNAAIARAKVAGYHVSGSAIGDLCVAPERQKDLIFGSTDTSAGANSLRAKISAGGTLTTYSGAIFNENSADVDFRVESNNHTHALFVDGANGNFMVGATSVADVNSLVSSHLIEGSSTTAGGGAVGIFNNTGTANCPALSVLNADASTDTTNRFMQFYANVSSSGATAMGGIVGNGASNVQFAALSDVREKTNIESINGSLDKIKALNPVEFDWIASGEHCNAGFVAQEVETIFPEFIVDNISSEGVEERKGLTGGMTGGIVAHLVKAIQEQQTLIESLTARITNLEG
jgi:hypothetical protein